MLRTDLLALAAFDTVGRFSSGCSINDIVMVVSIPVAVDLLGVYGVEQVGNGNVLGTSVCAVPAGGAGDKVLALEDGLYLFDGHMLGFVKWLEITHRRNVVLHLCHIAHAGKHHHHARKAGCKAKRIACRTAAAETFKNGFCLDRQIDKIAAFDRFHDDDRFVELTADLIAETALHGRIIVIGIIELNLHDLNVGIFG